MYANLAPAYAQQPASIVGPNVASAGPVANIQGPVAPSLLNNIPAGPGIIREPYVPVSQPQRFGPTQILHQIHFDTPVSAAGVTTLQNNERLFNNANRCSQEQLCSIREAGRFSDGKAVATHGLGFLCNFTQTPNLYELAVYFTYVYLEYQDSKKAIFWSDQMGAGGGVFGFDNNAAAFTLSNGNPNAGGFLSLSYPIIISLYRSFAFVWKWMSGLTGIVDPLTTFNADTARKLVRFYMHSVEGRDPNNG
jgi:hypothetical protein